MIAVQQPPRQLTDRDLAIIEMAHAYSGCTTEQLHARFWHEGSSLSACYRRIAVLIDAGYLHAQRLPSLTGIGSGKRFLTLGTCGQAILSERYGANPPCNRKASHERVTPLFVEHHVAIGDFRLALELAAAKADELRLVEWIPETVLRRKPIKVQIPGEGGREHETTVLVPDGAFTLLHGNRRQHCFLEMDMGTIAPRRLRIKVRGYLVHDVTPAAPIFFVAPTDARAQRISRVAKAEAEKLGQSPSRFFVTTRARITPDTILSVPIWEQAGVRDRQVIIRSSDRAVTAGAVP